jgi:hypothetical protein
MCGLIAGLLGHSRLHYDVRFRTSYILGGPVDSYKSLVNAVPPFCLRLVVLMSHTPLPAVKKAFGPHIVRAQFLALHNSLEAASAVETMDEWVEAFNSTLVCLLSF